MAGAIVTAEAWRSVSRHLGDHPVAILRTQLFSGVGNVEVAGGVHGNTLGIVNWRWRQGVVRR